LQSGISGIDQLQWCFSSAFGRKRPDFRVIRKAASFLSEKFSHQEENDRLRDLGAYALCQNNWFSVRFGESG